MQIKTFRGQTVQETIQLVRKELGPEAVIIKSKKVELSPGESCVEIMAAVEPDHSSHLKSEQGREDRTEFRDDIQEIKGLLSMLISSKSYFTQLQLEQPLAEIYHYLLLRGLDEKQTFLVLKKALQQMDGKPLTKEVIIREFCGQLLKRIRFAAPFQVVPSARRKIFTFLGPTGVGKTTTLAKLAAYLKIKKQWDVGVISVDTYRIGALNQLQTYTDILGIPLIVAQNSADLKLATERTRNCDVVLVDTIGKNFLQKQHVSDMGEIFSGLGSVYHFLVLSATAKDEDLRLIIKHFSVLGLQSLIFTKIDETVSHGSMINQLLKFPYPLAYLGTGQRVPEDIKAASSSLLVSCLFPSAKEFKKKEL